MYSPSLALLARFLLQGLRDHVGARALPRDEAAALNALITAATESMGGESIAEKRLMLSVCRLRSRNSFTSGGGPCECKPLPICSLGGEKTFPRDFSKKNVLP